MRERREYWAGKEVNSGATHGDIYRTGRLWLSPPSSTAPEGGLLTWPCCSLLSRNMLMEAVNVTKRKVGFGSNQNRARVWTSLLKHSVRPRASGLASQLSFLTC